MPKRTSKRQRPPASPSPTTVPDPVVIRLCQEFDTESPTANALGDAILNAVGAMGLARGIGCVGAFLQELLAAHMKEIGQPDGNDELHFEDGRRIEFRPGNKG